MKKRSNHFQPANRAALISKHKDSPTFPGVKSYKDRHGKVRWRVRDANDNTVNLGTDYGSPEFTRRYTKAMGLQVEATSERGDFFHIMSAVTSHDSDEGHTLSALIDAWYYSAQFRQLGPTTRYNYTNTTERLRKKYGHLIVEDFTRGNIKQIMQAKADRPESANADLRVLRLLFHHAEDVLEWIDASPAHRIMKFSPKNKGGYHTWTDGEISKFYEFWKLGTVADLAMTLMLYTGASRADAVRLGWGNVINRDGTSRIKYQREKMKTRGDLWIDIPIHPELAHRLELLPPEQGTFLETQHKRSRSPNGIGNSMREWCDAAGLSHCTSHGLRKACARRLAEAGATPHEIMAVTGHLTLAEVQRYTEKVERKGLADSALERIRNPTINPSNSEG